MSDILPVEPQLMRAEKGGSAGCEEQMDTTDEERRMFSKGKMLPRDILAMDK